jgi:hypothetical protein
MSNHINHHVAAEAAKLAKEAIRELEPLRGQKNVFLAAVLGFAFGPLGVAIYFGSVKDFFLCFGMLIFFSMLAIFGPGQILGWLFSPAYAAWRAHTSNQNLEAARSRNS